MRSGDRCPTGKAWFTTRGRADAKLREIDITNTQAAVTMPYQPIRAYRCTTCRCWHLTSWPTGPSPPR